MFVYLERMRRNLDLTRGLGLLQQLLPGSGGGRDALAKRAYAIAQRHAMEAWENDGRFPARSSRLIPTISSSCLEPRKSWRRSFSLEVGHRSTSTLSSNGLPRRRQTTRADRDLKPCPRSRGHRGCYPAWSGFNCLFAVAIPAYCRRSVGRESPLRNSSSIPRAPARKREGNDSPLRTGARILSERRLPVRRPTGFSRAHR